MLHGRSLLPLLCKRRKLRFVTAHSTHVFCVVCCNFRPFPLLRQAQHITENCRTAAIFIKSARFARAFYSPPQQSRAASAQTPQRLRSKSPQKPGSAGLLLRCPRRGGAASSAVRARGGYRKKFPWELFSYLRGTASPLEISSRSGSARYGRWRRPVRARCAPHRRCGSYPTDCPADGGCPMRSSRSSPGRLPESASCR